MKAKRRKSKFQPQRKHFERRWASYSLASGALLATGAVAPADVIVWDSSNASLPQTASTNGGVYFDFLTGTVNSSYFPGVQFRVINSYSRQAGTRLTYTYTTSTDGSQIRHTHSFPYTRMRSAAYGSRFVSSASFRGNGFLAHIYSGSV